MQNTSPEKIQKDTFEKLIEDEWEQGFCFGYPWIIRSQLGNSGTDAIHKPELAVFARNVLARYNQSLSAKVQARIKEHTKDHFKGKGWTNTAISEDKYFLKILEENKVEKTDLDSASPRNHTLSVAKTMIKGDSK